MNRPYPLLITFLLPCALAGQGLYDVEVLTTSIDHPFVHGLDFPTPARGYVAWSEFMEGGVLTTSDSGATWSQCFWINNSVRDVCFSNADSGYVATALGVFRTTDGGNSWDNVLAGYFQSVFLLGFDTVFTTSMESGIEGIHRSTDAGENWTQILDSADVCGVYFANSHLGFANHCSNPWTALRRTTDGGNSWAPFEIPGNAHGIEQYFFTSPDTGYAQEFEHGIYKTMDGGETWSPLFIPTSNHLHDVHFVDAETGFAVGGTTVPEGVILQTDDGGTSWYTLFHGQGISNLVQLDFPDAGVGYAVGNTYYVLRITRRHFVGMGEEQEPVVSMYPNPTTGSMHIGLPKGAEEVLLTNVLGAVVIRSNVRGQQKVDLSLDTPGVYFVQVMVDGCAHTQKLVVQRD